MKKDNDPVVKAVAGLITSHHTTVQVVDSLRAALAAEGLRLQELLEAVTTMAENSVDTYTRLKNLEDEVAQIRSELKPAS